MSQAADRHLLFGLLALQTGLIRPDQLVAAFHAWTLDKTRPIDDHLGVLNGAQKAAIEVLVQLHAETHGGDVAESLASIPAGRSTLEQLTALADPDLDATLSHVAPRPEPTEGDADRTGTYHVGSATSEGQRFRVLRPHAKGGLGAVYVALDSELNREVALKQILENHADDPVSRGRFLVEAEITGGLEHPGIVPVYGLGTYGDGRPYYAMRFIRGDSLREAIDTFHKKPKSDPHRLLEFRQLLKKFTDVCNAIEYAHSRGVIHRDIKPANVIVGKHGETLVVDWGLAKALGKSSDRAAEQTLIPSSGDGSSETLPGQAMGTPAYMSPEQARGDLEKLGPRSDVYSLGATLYCLQCGQAPFEGHPAAVLKAVEAGDFRRPRERDASIDPALEAIALKAMAKDPADRYGSARELAVEIDRWLADERVEAYPEPWTRSLNRWLTRHRTGVTGIAAAGLVALVGLGIVSAVQAKARRDLDAKNGALTRANADLDFQRARAEERESQAIDAVKRFKDAVTENSELKNNPALRPLRKALLREPLAFFGDLRGRLEADRDTRAGSLARFASVIRDHAVLLGEIDDKRAALRAFEEARAILQRLALANPDDHRFEDDLGACYFRIGALTTSTGRADEALVAYEAAREIYERLASGHPDRFHYRFEWAGAISNIGVLLDSMGRAEEAFRAYERALDIRGGLAREHPDDAAIQSDLAGSYNNIGTHHESAGRYADAMQAYERSREIRERLARDRPGEIEARVDLADSLNNIGSLLNCLGRADDGLRAYEQARDVRERLAHEHPSVADFRAGVDSIDARIGRLLDDAGRPAEALEAFERARASLEGLLADHPGIARYQDLLAECHRGIGLLRDNAGRAAEALRSHELAAEIEERLSRENPKVSKYREGLAASLFNIGKILADSGRIAEALDTFEQSREIRESLVGGNPGDPGLRNQLAGTQRRIGSLLAGEGRNEEALKALEQAQSLWEALAREQTEEPKYRLALSLAYCDISRLAEDMDRADEARKAHEASIAIQDQFIRDHPDDPERRERLAKCLNNLGLLSGDIGRIDEALAAHRRALEIRERLALEHPEAPDYASDLGGSWNNMALIDLDASRFAKAREKLLKAIGLQKKALAADPRNPQYRQFLESHLSCLIDAERGLGHDDEADRAAGELAEFRLRDPKFEVLDTRLKAIRDGGEPADRVEGLALAQRAYDTRRFAIAAKLWGYALDSAPELASDRQAQHPYDAACAAALAADGKGIDPPDDAGKARLRGQALEWLKSEKDAWSKALESGQPDARQAVAKTLRHWQEDADLASVRGEEALSKLPDDEQAAWKALWEGVDELLRKAE